jgi:ornithine carbamoyltransferase
MSAEPAPTVARPCKDFLSILDFDASGLEHCIELAIRMKAERRLGAQAPTRQLLQGRYVAMLFEKPSLRTRTTFEIAVRELGGDVISLQPDVAIGRREPVVDIARNLERWVHAVVIRTFSHHTIEEFAAAAPRLHVVNALTDEQHPCQALADLTTLRERLGPLAGRTLAFVGDGNNMATSLAHACAMLGVHFHVASPEGYELDPAVVHQASRIARHGAHIRLFTEPADAVAGVDAVYTDTWTSMGQESETEQRRAAFFRYQVNGALMTCAKPGAFFMHCLPAHRGEEVTTDVFESSASLVFDQAENRLHGQKALLAILLGGR